MTPVREGVQGVKRVKEEDRAGPLVFCHLETLRSSRSPSLHLTQLAATAAGSSFFRAVLPSVLPGYLDTCRLGGDLLQTLNMTREDGGTFLFRQPVLVRRQTERVECRPELEALQDFLAFLEAAGPGAVLVTMDEETAGVLQEKLQAVDSTRYLAAVAGHTWWRRVLHHMNMSGYRNIELEDFHSSAFPAALATELLTANVVAAMLSTSVAELARTHHGGQPLDSGFVARTAVPRELRPTQQRREVAAEGGREMLEVYTSFRPEASALFTVEEMEQVDLVGGVEPRGAVKAEPGAVKAEPCREGEVVREGEVRLRKLREENAEREVMELRQRHAESREQMRMEELQQQQDRQKQQEGPPGPPGPGQPNRRLPGKLAVCKGCGFTSKDLAVCLRCRRKMPDDVKLLDDPTFNPKPDSTGEAKKALGRGSAWRRA